VHALKWFVVFDLTALGDPDWSVVLTES